MKHAIITRLIYEDKNLFAHRVQLMSDILIPCLNNQINRDFTLIVMVLDEDVEYLKQHLNYPFINFSDYADLRKFCVENKVRIQTRHDSDDWMSHKYVLKIQEEYERLKDNPHNMFLLQFYPEKINYRTGQLISALSYRRDFNSGFLTLCQSGDVSKIVYEKSHTEMHKITGTAAVYSYGFGWVKYYIHGANDSLRPLNERLKNHKF